MPRRSPLWDDPRVKPPFGATINWGHPLARGLSFVMPINELGGPPNPIWIDQGRLFTLGSAPFAPSTAWGLGPEGPGITLGATNSAVRWIGTSIAYSLPQDNGTVIVCHAPGFATNSGAAHDILQIGARKDAGFPSYNSLQIEKNSSNNMIMGWVWGADDRISFSAAGLWSVGQTVQFGLAWDKAVTPMLRAFINGVQKGTDNSITTGDTSSGGANNVFQLGNFSFAGTNTTNAATGTAYWLTIWRRTLTPYEMAWVAAEPFAFYTMPIRRTFSFAAGPTEDVLLLQTGDPLLLQNADTILIQSQGTPVSATSVQVERGRPSWRGAWRGHREA